MKLEFVNTQWNGEPCTAICGTAIVADHGTFPAYWAREYVGQRRPCVLVIYRGRRFVLDNADGSGWAKVTNGGSPFDMHRDLEIVSGSFEADVP